MTTWESLHSELKHAVYLHMGGGDKKRLLSCNRNTYTDIMSHVTSARVDLTHLPYVVPSLDSVQLDAVKRVTDMRIDCDAEFGEDDAMDSQLLFICLLLIHVPRNLRRLEFRSCRVMRRLPASMPATLCALEFRHCDELERLPEPLPSALHELVIDDCGSLTRLPQALPPTLRILKCHACPGLRLPNRLPPTLQEVIITEESE